MPIGLPAKDLKGHVPVVYLRVSTKEQGGVDKDKPPLQQKIFKQQLSTIEAYLKRNKLRSVQKQNIFAEVGSGGDPTRPMWTEALNRAISIAGTGRQAFVITKDPTRWSRDSFYGSARAIPLREMDVPLVFATDDMVLGTLARREPDADTLFQLKMALSEGERGRAILRVRAGLEALEEAGIFPRGALPLWPFATRNPWLYLLETYLAARPKGEGGIGQSAYGRALTAALGPYGPSITWHKKAIPRLLEIKRHFDTKEGPDAFQNWLDHLERIRQLEVELQYDAGGLRVKPKQGKERAEVFPLKALRYRFGGYQTRPDLFKMDGDIVVPTYQRPDDVTFAETFDNPIDFLSDKERANYRRIIGKRSK